MSRIHADAIADGTASSTPERRAARSAGSSDRTPDRSPAPATTAPGPVDRVARRLVLGRVAGLQLAPISFEGGGDRVTVGDPSAGPAHEVRVNRPRFWRRLATGGSLGLAESWMQGEWDTDDLAGLLGTFVRDEARTDAVEGRLAAFGDAIARLGHRLAANTRAGSRRNIRAHYDLGNELFGLFLDETMTYSAARFERDDMSLADAQVAKLDRMCRVLDLGPDSEVLEIGTGWGSFALHAAGHYGSRVTTTTISQEQHDLAQRRVAAAGLQDRITIVMQDYRDLRGTYDAVASIEMIEAVGHRFLPAYFRTISQRLRPDGRACVQAISMPDHRYDAYRRRVDFIQRYVFPGSCCPSVTAISSAMASGSDLRITGLEDMGLDYVRTLRTWRENFDARLEAVRGLGYDERFVRLWQYYLAYCEAGFAHRYISVAQIAMARTGGPPASRRAEQTGPGAATSPAGPAPDAARVVVPPIARPGSGP
jgi:cyclopropane-fatty-acyl-phospholipid synthase